MPKISCPGCSKQYSVPASAAGQVATCKQCGKKFRLGQAKASAVPAPKVQTVAKTQAAVATAQPVKKTQPAKKTQPVAKAVSTPAPDTFSDPSDSFWDESIPERTPGPVPAAKSKGFSSGGASGTSSTSIPAGKPAKPKKKKKSGGVKWGADWGAFVGGIATFVVVGAAAGGLIYATGRINKLTVSMVVIAFLGLFKGLSGLMGEEGIW